MRRISVLGLLLIGLAGCGTGGIPDDLPLEQAPPSAVASPSPQALAPTAEAAPPAADGLIAMIAPDREAILGGYQQGRWLEVQDMLTLLTGPVDYVIYPDLVAAPFTVLGYPPLAENPMLACMNNYSVYLDPSIDGKKMIGVNSTWNVLPRQIEEASVLEPEYQDLARQIVVDHGMDMDVASPLVVTRVLRGDLNGDGTDEVLLAAMSLGFTELTLDAPAGNYSFVALQTLVDDQPQTMLLNSNFFPRDEFGVRPATMDLRGVADLNGDGTLEVLMDSTYYYGWSVGIFEFDGRSIEYGTGTACMMPTE